MKTRTPQGEDMLVRMLASDAPSSELTTHLRRLVDDLDRMAAGTTPTAAELAQVPPLVDWRLAVTWNGLSLMGFAAGHPLLGSKQIVTSRLGAFDPEGKRARTRSRFCRLGVPAGRVIPRDDISPYGGPYL